MNLVSFIPIFPAFLTLFLNLIPTIFCQYEVATSYRGTCVLVVSNVTCWGRGYYGRNGQGNTENLYEPPMNPIDLGDNFEPKNIDCGGSHCCAVSTGNDSKCWGSNTYGQLGQGDSNNRGDQEGEMGDALKIIDFGSDFKIDHLSCGDSHTCALSANNTIKCFGGNEYGQLGYETTENMGDESGEMGDDLPTVDLGANFVPIQVECGWGFTCALSVHHNVKCWGRNTFGQLGQGDKITRGAGAGTMGDELSVIDLGTDFNVNDIRCGTVHVCALSRTHAIKCWGDNFYGELGLGDNMDRGDDINEMGDWLPVVDLGSDFISQIIATGAWHSLSVSTNGSLKSWGDGEHGQLGYGEYWWKGDHQNEMGDYLPIVDFGSGLSIIGISDSAQSEHTCTILSEYGQPMGLKCFGLNDEGQLGYGDVDDEIGDEAGEMGDDLPFVLFFSTNEPTNDPTTDPTADPTVDPTNDPTEEPTNYPTYEPTQHPSASPTPPTTDPTAAPSTSPSVSPTASPLSLHEKLTERVDDQWKFDEFSEMTCYVVLGLGCIVVGVAFAIGHRKSTKCDKYHVEGQEYLSVILYVTQIVDVLSDIFFSIQMNQYYQRGQLYDDIDHEVFARLLIISVIFVGVPYIMNITSSVRVVQNITAGDSISGFTKKYFQKNAKLYSVLTIFSGGAFPALKVMNSDFLSLSIFNAGLSDLQLERFRVHHVLSTLIMENLPQLAVQAFVVFKLKISSTVILISFASSVFNVMMSVLTAAVYVVLHRNQNDSKFTILVSWSAKMGSLRVGGNVGAIRRQTMTDSNSTPHLNPFSRTGRRKTLAKQLGLIKFHGSNSVKFEILASEKHCDGYLLYCVMQSDAENQSAATLLANFMDKEREILRAIINAFGYSPHFTNDFAFQIEISQSDLSSRADKVKMVSNLLTELGVDKLRIRKSLGWIAVRTPGTTLSSVAEHAPKTFAETSLFRTTTPNSPIRSAMTLEDDTIRSITGIVNDVKHYQIENERLRQQLKNRDRELVAAKVKIRKLEGKLQVPEAGLSVHHHYGYEVSNTIQVPDAGQPVHQHYGYDVSKTKSMDEVAVNAQTEDILQSVLQDVLDDSTIERLRSQLAAAKLKNQEYEERLQLAEAVQPAQHEVVPSASSVVELEMQTISQRIQENLQMLPEVGSDQEEGSGRAIEAFWE